MYIHQSIGAHFSRNNDFKASSIFFFFSPRNRNVFYFQWNKWNSWIFINTRNNKEIQRNSLRMDCVRSADCNSLCQIINNTRFNQIAHWIKWFPIGNFIVFISSNTWFQQMLSSRLVQVPIKQYGALNGKSLKIDQRKHFLMFMRFFHCILSTSEGDSSIRLYSIA